MPTKIINRFIAFFRNRAIVFLTYTAETGHTYKHTDTYISL